VEIYSSENEQIDAVRNFFRENGKAIVLGIVIGAGGLFGWRYWQTHQVTSANEASMGYDTVVSALKSGDGSAESATASFINANPNSYGAMAALELAKHYVEKGNLAEAQKQLESAVKQTKDIDLAAMMNLRLARIQFAQNQIEPALATLAKVQLSSWAAEAELIRGNILFSQGKADEAKAAYNKGLTLNPSQVIESQIKLQLENVGA
jgi:predicted negative regulator of RcsB-dependent stress response